MNSILYLRLLDDYWQLFHSCVCLSLSLCLLIYLLFIFFMTLIVLPSIACNFRNYPDATWIYSRHCYKNWWLLQKPPCFFSHIFVPIVFPNVVSLFCHLLHWWQKAQLFFIQHLLFDICVYLFITYYLINVLLIKAWLNPIKIKSINSIQDVTRILCDNCMIVDLRKMNVEIKIVENLIKWLMPRVISSVVKNKIAWKHVWKWYVGFN